MEAALPLLPNGGGWEPGIGLDADPQGLERLIASLPTALIALAPDGTVTHWNATAVALFGCPAGAVIGRPLGEAPIRWDWARLRGVLENRRADSGPVKVDNLAFVRPEGGEGILGLTISPVAGTEGGAPGLVIIGGDITERRAFERQLAQAEKLRSIGQLTAGIAHEINTPIQYLGDNIRFLSEAFAELLEAVRPGRERPGDSPPGAAGAPEPAADLSAVDLDYLLAEIPEAIRHSLEGVERISRIVRAMKEFAHPGREEKSRVDLNAVIETTITVARNAWKYVAEMRTDFDPALPPVLCHPGEISQVVLNLIINAAQAIEERIRTTGAEKGEIAVSTGRRGQWVEIRVRDNGIGVPEEIRPHIFDPFFTTKEIGRGSGQGLAICYPVVVERHGGRVSFESEAGRGTEFTVALPLALPAG
jgi:PAS domain S-box-containing protein